MACCLASRKQISRKETYATVEKECLGLIWEVLKISEKPIYGKHYIIESDHIFMQALVLF